LLELQNAPWTARDTLPARQAAMIGNGNRLLNMPSDINPDRTVEAAYPAFNTTTVLGNNLRAHERFCALAF